MSNAPERIFVDRQGDILPNRYVKMADDVEYIRADLHREISIQQAAQVLMREVLQKASPEAVEFRNMMMVAIMKHRIPSASSKDRWHMVNDAIQYLAENGPEIPE